MRRLYVKDVSKVKNKEGKSYQGSRHVKCVLSLKKPIGRVAVVVVGASLRLSASIVDICHLLSSLPAVVIIQKHVISEKKYVPGPK